MLPKQEDPIIVPLGEGVEMTFRHIPAGHVCIGQRGGNLNEEPVTAVVVPDFWMGETPVTRAQYWELAKSLGVDRSPGPSLGDKFSPLMPVCEVSWDSAMAVAVAMDKLMKDLNKLPSAHVVGLPSEAMWEYACRAGTETDYYNGDGEAALAEIGWFSGNSGHFWHPVAEFPANAWGLYDMHGHVREWCADAFQRNYESPYRTLLSDQAMPCPVASPRAEADDNYRAIRGGSWYYPASNCHSAYRTPYRPWDKTYYLGFRLCLFHGSGDVCQGLESEAGESWDDAKLPPRSGDGIF